VAPGPAETVGVPPVHQFLRHTTYGGLRLPPSASSLEAPCRFARLVLRQLEAELPAPALVCARSARRLREAAALSLTAANALQPFLQIVVLTNRSVIMVSADRPRTPSNPSLRSKNILPIVRITFDLRSGGVIFFLSTEPFLTETKSYFGGCLDGKRAVGKEM
jgi:hypothetical protein